MKKENTNLAQRTIKTDKAHTAITSVFLEDSDMNKGGEQKIIEPRLMTHLVAGYPDIKTNLQSAEAMERAGVSLLELQLPFSDPLADGPVIMRANHRALKAGMTFAKCLSLIKELHKRIKIPLVVMTYYNLPYSLGVEKFLEALSVAGVAGLILPDIPYDCVEENYYSQLEKYVLAPIFVVSPQTNDERLSELGKRAQAMVYTTLRIGITGTQDKLAAVGIEQFLRLRKFIKCPIAAGFGISQPKQLLALRGLCDMAVIGSKLITVVEEEGVSGITNFLASCRRVLETP